VHYHALRSLKPLQIAGFSEGTGSYGKVLVRDATGFSQEPFELQSPGTGQPLFRA
jgi:hypothetical protein